MRISPPDWLSFLLLWAAIFPAVAHESGVSPSSTCGQHTATVTSAAAPTFPSVTFDEVINRVVEREHLFLAQMCNLRPVVETYLQNLRSDAKGRVSPLSDQYFLRRLNMSDNIEVASFVEQTGSRINRFSKLNRLFSPHFLALGFAQMIMPDSEFYRQYRQYYNFTLVRHEFLGQVRCLVIDVQPRPEARGGRFKGLIWAEDRDFNIVRFSGTYVSPLPDKFYLHFDSWRLNLKPGLWLPAYIYSEDSDLKTNFAHIHFKAQTRLWGYDLRRMPTGRTEQFGQILIDSQPAVKDESGTVVDATTAVDERMRERETEDSVVERLQNVGLLAPASDVDKVLQTVTNNLFLANNIDLKADVHFRVLLTSPLESFTIGHTIVVSRGLLDVLPDEASLGMVLAHELGHIILGHHFQLKLAFGDQMFFADEQSFRRLDFKHRFVDEEAADAKALELLENSPYGERLGTAGIFLEALQRRGPDLPNLIRPHRDNSFAAGQSIRMSPLLTAAPQLDEHRIDQIVALPLGGRIKLDPWSDQVQLVKAEPVTSALAREKMTFEITRFFPYLTRLQE
jgi:hypothetical protein